MPNQAIIETDLYKWQALTGNCIRAHKSPRLPWLLRVEGLCPITNYACAFEGSGMTLESAMRDLLIAMSVILSRPEVQIAIGKVEL